MSDFNFQTFSRIELNYLADKFEALVKGNQKKDFADALVAKGVTEEAAKEALKERAKKILESHPNHQSAIITNEDTILLVRMRRANPSYKYRNYHFTREHPYVLMRTDDANDLLKMETGFVLATPEEVKEFYGRS